MKRLLWIGDAVVSTGFARCTHKTLEAFRDDWDIHVLGLNYKGDPHPYPYDIYPAHTGGDAFGVRRTAVLVSRLKPDVVIIQNDPWNVPAYMKQTGNAPVIASMPVDGLNCRGAALNGLTHAIFWTNFGAQEARRGGYAGTSGVVPLGVDLNVYKPTPRAEARERLGLPGSVRDAFIVANVNRNQPRKRLDLTIEYFWRWVRSRGIDDAFLFLHVAPTGEEGCDVQQLMQFYGLANRLIICEPDIGTGVSEEELANTYSCFDVQVSTSQGEGWGLTTMEGMACGIPQIVPEWAALGEWARGAATLVHCSATAVTPNGVNAIGGIADRGEFLVKLDELYSFESKRGEATKAGLELVGRPEYRWESVAEKFRTEVETATGGFKLVDFGSEPLTLNRHSTVVK